MADNFPVINAAGATTYIRAIQLAGGTYVNMSIPSLANGTAMIGSAVMANSMPVTIATDQQAITAVVSGTVTSVVSGTVTAVISGIPQVNLTAVGGAALVLGAAASAASIPVVIATNQTAIPVSGTVTATFGGTATVNISQINGSAISLGQVAMASSFPVVLASNQSALTAVVSGTVTSVISGTPQVNLTAVGGAALVLGAAASAASIPVVIATNQTAIPISGSITATNASAALATVSSTSGTPAAVAVKASSGVLSMVGTYCNSTTYPVFLKIFNVTAAGVSSAVVPVITIGIPPGAVSNIPIAAGGIYLGGTGISYIVTKLVANTDTTAVANYDLVGAIGYI